MTTIAEAFVTIRPDTKGFEGEAERSVARGMSGAHKAAVAGGALVGAAVVGAAVKGTQAFVDFERGMNEVFTLIPGTSAKAMAAMQEDVKAFSKEFKVLPDQVVPALYQSLSAGVPQDNVFAFLEVAQKAAVGGVTELATAVDGISSVVNAYGADVVDAAKASDLMFTAVRLGKTTFPELSQSLFQVIPTASALGVEFGDVTAALAAMTAQGTPTAVATTQMRQLFVELSKDGGKTAKVFEDLAGKSFKEFVAGGGDVQQALQLLEKHAQKSGVGVNDLFGSVEAGAAALSLTGKGTETFARNLGEMANSAGATEKAYAQMDQGIGRAFDQLKASAQVLLIEIGERLAPVLLSIATWASENTGTVLAIAGVIGGVLVAAFVAWAIAAAQAAIATFAAIAPLVATVAPMIAVGLAIAGVVTGLVYLWENWQKIWTAAKDLVGEKLGGVIAFVQELPGSLVSVLSGAWGAFWSWFSDAWTQVGEFVYDVVANIVDWIGALPGRLLGALQGAWDLYYRYYVSIWMAAGQFVLDRVGDIVRFITELPGRIRDGLASTWQTFWGYVTGVFDAVRDLVSDRAGGMVNIFAGLPGRMIEAIKVAAGPFIAVGSWIIERHIEGIRLAADMVGGLFAFFRDMPGKIVGFVMEKAGQLIQLGKDIIGKIVEGIKAVPGAIGDAITGLFKGIKLPSIDIPFIGGDGPGKGALTGGSALARVKSVMPRGTYVTSTYRTPAQNRAAGGSPTSYHLDRSNPAVDIGGSTAALDALYTILKRMGGYRELIWKQPGHYDHLHYAHGGGRVEPSWPTLPNLRANERPAILEVGEQVLTEEQQALVASGGVPGMAFWDGVATRMASAYAREFQMAMRTA